MTRNRTLHGNEPEPTRQGTGPCMTRNGNLHVGFGDELQKCGRGEVKEQNVTCRGMKHERLVWVVMVVVLELRSLHAMK